MKLKRRIGERGQITVPKDMREQLGFLPNSDIYFSEEDGKLVLEKEDESFSDWSRELSEKIGKPEKNVEDYRKEQFEGRI
jgi:AbrB family looped-hinge helix DNA binding protein